MANTLTYTDRTGLINIEGQSIIAKFDRLSPTTGRVSWNIPQPAAGCDANTRAYNGFIVVGGISPMSLVTAPVNGQFYKGDASMDSDLHAGDKIGHAFVVASKYNDVTTTFVDVTDLDPTKPYYFAVHAVDNVINYYRAGAHTYSPSSEETITGATPAWHTIVFPETLLKGGPTQPTNLLPNQNYTITLEVECKTHTVVIPGASAQTFGDLVSSINAELDKIDVDFIGVQPPNTGTLFLSNDGLHRWMGNGYDDIDLFLHSPNDPLTLPTGAYWHDTLNARLFSRGVGSWQSRNFITFTADPTIPGCGMFLFNGTVVFRWTGSAWVETPTFVQSTNPFVPQIDSCTSYWYNESTSQLLRRSNGRWDGVSAVYYDTDPNLLNDGTYWFNSSTKQLSQRTGSSWVSRPAVVRATTPTPTGGMLWYNPTTQTLKQRDALNTSWLRLDVVVFERDPSMRRPADLWWEASTDTLREWDDIHDQWVNVAQFVISDFDPASGVVVSEDATWYNPVTGELHTWRGPCDSTSVLLWPNGDPRDMVDGTIWYNPITKIFKVRTSPDWTTITPIQYPGGPEPLILGTFWFNGTSLFQWNGASWIELMFTRTDVTPPNGFKWYNTQSQSLMMWNGASWVPSRGVASVVVFIAPEKRCWVCPKGAPYKAWKKSGLYFLTEKTGSDQCIKVLNSTLFGNIGGVLSTHTEGGDGVSDLPPYLQQGVGTDGTMEARKILARDIELALGGGTGGVSLELTREDIDHSIDRALRMLRARAAPYVRAYFPIRMPDTNKRVLLTNKTLGHDKIVRVIGIYRTHGTPVASTAGTLGSSYPMMYGTLAGRPGGDLATYYLESAYIDELATITARRVTFFFNEKTRVLEIHNTLARGESLLIEASTEMLEQDILMDRRYRVWIERWAVAESQMKLAEIRGKFQTIPGPGGGVVMNGAELRAAATETFTQLIAEIDNFVVIDPTEFPGALFTIG